MHVLIRHCDVGRKLGSIADSTVSTCYTNCYAVGDTGSVLATAAEVAVIYSGAVAVGSGTPYTTATDSKVHRT